MKTISVRVNACGHKDREPQCTLMDNDNMP